MELGIMRNGLIFITTVFALLSEQSPALAQFNRLERRGEHGIIVSGECLSKLAQDRGSVTIGSSVLANNPKEASEKAVSAHEAIKKGVRDLALKDFIAETAEYSVTQDCSYHEGKRVCEGYRATIATRFETSEIPRLGDVIGVASKLGTADVSALNTFASPEKLKEAREACLEVAMRNAAAKARTIAQGAGVALGRLISVQEGRDDAPHPGPLRTRSFEQPVFAEAQGAPSVESRPLDIVVELTARYDIEGRPSNE
jgi:uncharacterized protein YggE